MAGRSHTSYVSFVGHARVEKEGEASGSSLEPKSGQEGRRGNEAPGSGTREAGAADSPRWAADTVWPAWSQRLLRGLEEPWRPQQEPMPQQEPPQQEPPQQEPPQQEPSQQEPLPEPQPPQQEPPPQEPP